MVEANGIEAANLQESSAPKQLRFNNFVVGE